MLKEIKIHKYRGFKDVSFKIGSQLTIIAGQNGALYAIVSDTDFGHRHVSEKTYADGGERVGIKNVPTYHRPQEASAGD